MTQLDMSTPSELKRLVMKEDIEQELLQHHKEHFLREHNTLINVTLISSDLRATSEGIIGESLKR